MTTTTVRLAVYDISGGMARQFAPMLGLQLDYLPHTGILVFGQEFFYGGGIQQMRHEEVIANYGLRPVRDPEVLGRTERTKDEFLAFLRSIEATFSANTYDLMQNNCNHFSDACAKFLLQGTGIPQEIVTLPNLVLQSPIGQMLRPMLENLQTQMQNQFAQHHVELPATASPPPTLVSSITALQAICAMPRENLEAMTTLHRVVKNIVENPMEAKYLRVPIQNQKFHATLGRHSPHGINSLLGIGFQREAESLVLRPTEEQWTKLVWSEKIVAAARKRAIGVLCQGLVSKEEALRTVFVMEPGKEDQFVLQALDDLFKQ